jgi:hypothetical protein
LIEEISKGDTREKAQPTSGAAQQKDREDDFKHAKRCIAAAAKKASRYLIAY